MSEPVRGAWLVIAPGWPPFPMVCSPCTRAEALESARVIWPTAEIGDY